jgi:hypothetical protein
MNNLTYNIVEARLQGFVNGVLYNEIACSGGRAGSKTAGAAHPILSNNPFLTHIKKDALGKDSPGGALPLGIYKLIPHESRTNWIRLIPAQYNTMHNRDGFAIHGRGQRGSDGCIVPENFRVVLELLDAAKFRAKKGISPLILEVIAVGDLDYFLNKMDRYARTA